jgi:hypothetical protein
MDDSVGRAAIVTMGADFVERVPQGVGPSAVAKRIADRRMAIGDVNPHGWSHPRR